MLGTGLLDWWLALMMARWPAHRRALLVCSLVSNLGVLAFFKYADWGLEQATVLAGWFGMPAPASTPGLDLILPVGISFYTFQSLSYTIDVYRGRLRPVSDPIHLLAYLSLFPQLVAGPIVRASELLPQLETPGKYGADSRWQGLVFMTRGFFKKCVIADQVAPAVNTAFGGGAGELGGPAWWIAALLFGVQIYADFSGYSDIAKGLARWMGYRFPDNFRTPYLATSPREFWSRWHVSLSTWFRDYLYVPLGGSRHGHARTIINLVLTMLISGLWHGANWTFLAWGAWHAIFLVGQRVLAIARDERPLGVPTWARWMGTMLIVLIGWVLFRASNMQHASAILTAMTLDWRSVGAAQFVHPALVTAVASMVAIDLLDGARVRRAPNVRAAVRRFFWRPCIAAPVVIGLAIAACVALRGPGDAFIYFQF
ncbi:MAG: MBOAT family protein [Phycisphaerae bacterium]|nr:MBOAT family protein [Phycisphaerae bacterium]